MDKTFAKMTLKDWITVGGIILTGAGFYYGTNYRLGAMEDGLIRVEKSVERIEAGQDKTNTKIEIDLKRMEAEINAVTLRIELLKQDVEYIKGGRR